MTAMMYETPVKEYGDLNSPCCDGDICAVYYDPDDRVVLCHICGHVWHPKALVRFAVEEKSDD